MDNDNNNKNDSVNRALEAFNQLQKDKTKPPRRTTPLPPPPPEEEDSNEPED